MASRTVELVALGPPPVDPYEPWATAWALAAACAARSDRVRVLHPEGPRGAEPPAGTVGVPVPLPLRRPGAAPDEAEFAAAAGRRVAPGADLVLRDPAGFGSLGLGGRRAGRPKVVAFVRSIELRAFDRAHAARGSGRLVDRLDVWRYRRAVRRLEQAALNEADLLVTDAPELPRELAQEYGVPEQRLRPAVPPVPDLASPPSRDAARASLGIPTDVPVVVAPMAEERAEPAGLDRTCEAFRRIRPFFPGARLVVVGAAAPADPGVVSVPGRDPGSFSLGLRAANVALFAGRRPGFDPLLVSAMRAGVAPAAVPGIRLPVDPDGAVRYAPSDDPGDLASTLAELLADPTLCREVADRGEKNAEQYLPERVLQAVDAALREVER
jgi:glycosyltransferase involved in cell wall biosynthesis